jgi:predicted dehydrogenase
VIFTCVVDPNVELATKRIQVMQKGPQGDKWASAKAFKTSKEMLASPEKPQAAFIGVPPMYHGSIDDPKADIELQLAKAGIHLFVEKPLSVKSAEEVGRLAEELARQQREHGLVIAVGYMLRYSPVVQAARKLLQEYNAKPASIMARYACAYSTIKKRDWWDTSICGGPIVEQATHFVDLLRYFGGEVAEESIKAVAVGPSLPLSDMPAAPDAEHTVPEDKRINRVTTSIFRFKEGGVGTLTHTVLLHEAAYHTAFEIMADGLHMLIEDPYDQASLTVRRPHSGKYEKVDLESEDMYKPQARAFVEAVRTGDTSGIHSLFSDAVESYKVSQWITAASSADST